MRFVHDTESLDQCMIFRSNARYLPISCLFFSKNLHFPS